MILEFIHADRTSMSWSPSASRTWPELGTSVRYHHSWISRLIQWFVEARSHRIICLVLGIWLLNGFDLAFTILAHRHGLLHEENPIARLMLQNGTVSIVLFKIGLVLIGTYPLLRFRRARITEMGACLVLAAYVFLAIRWSVCVELYSATLWGHVSLHDFAGLLGYGS